MRFSTIITVRSLKSLLELIRSFFLILLKSKPLKMRILHFPCRSYSYIALSLRKSGFAREQSVLERFERAMWPALTVPVCICTVWYRYVPVRVCVRHRYVYVLYRYLRFNIYVRYRYVPVCMCSVPVCSVVDTKLFFSDPDPTFQEISDPDPILDPT